MEEKNQKTTGIRIHDIIVRTQVQKTDEEGNKLGYLWNNKGIIGVVTEVSEDKLVIKKADTNYLTHDVNDVEKEYYYTLSFGSEVEYRNEIERLISQNNKKVVALNEETSELNKWLIEFTQSISLLGKLSKFVRDFNSK